MPCVIILRDDLYDIVITTDKPDKIRRLYELGVQHDAIEEEPAPLNTKILETTGSLWITSGTAIYNDEADFRQKFGGHPLKLAVH